MAAMTASTWRTVTYCAVCDRLEVEHEARANGSRGKRLATSGQAVRSASSPGVGCPGFTPGRVEERPPEDELRRRLAAAVALHAPIGHPKDQMCPVCMDDRGVNDTWPCPTVRAARGET